ncbi:MAG: M28 family peptidase [Proteobacteria bacterium]|nr:M28 family peptidase [Pseudomonadota bacterium]
MSPGRTKLAAALAALSLAASARAETTDAVSETKLRADVEKLVSFGTRHTLSSQDDPARGIGAARRWAEATLRETSKACGDCLTIVLPETLITGERIKQPTRLVNVVAVQRGTDRPNEVVIVQGHIDSRVTDVMDAISDAPGANDDGSGTALVLEAARVLSKRKYPTTIVYAVLSGEEQGLFGGQLLADYAKSQGWIVKAVLNNDIVGNTRGSDGLIDNKMVRVFSEGPRSDSDDAIRAAARRFGGENDSPSRNLSRYAAGLAKPELRVRQVWRTDRMGRGGDHVPFLGLGYPAIRFTVGVENYDHQHQNLRTEKGTVYGDTIDFMDFAYLAKVTRLNVAVLDRLAQAPMPPEPQVEAAVQTYTMLRWEPVAGAVSYRIWRRRTDAPGWNAKPQIVKAGQPTEVNLAGVRGDDWLFGVSSVDSNGIESPVASAVPGGAFRPLK